MGNALIRQIIDKDPLFCDEPYHSVLTELRDHLYNKGNVKINLIFNVKETPKKSSVIKEVAETFGLAYGSISETSLGGVDISEGYFMNSFDEKVTAYFSKTRDERIKECNVNPGMYKLMEDHYKKVNNITE